MLGYSAFYISYLTTLGFFYIYFIYILRTIAPCYAQHMCLRQFKDNSDSKLVVHLYVDVVDMQIF